MAPSPTRSNSEKFLVKCEPTAPKIQSTLAARPALRRSWLKFQTCRPQDCSSTNFKLAPSPTLISTIPACREAALSSGEAASWTYVTEAPSSTQTRICEICARPPPGPHNRLLSGCSTFTPLGTYSTTPFCESAPARAANLPSSGRTSSPAMRFTSWGFSARAVAGR